MKKNKKKVLQKPSPVEDHKLQLYKHKMSIIWIGFSIAGVLISALTMIYSSNIFSVINESKQSFIVYVVILFIWRAYRASSRNKIRYSENFQSKIDSDYNFAKKYNNVELIKTITTYLFIAIPAFYSSGISTEVLSCFGIQSKGFTRDIHELLISVQGSIGTLAFGYVGSYIYDKTKHILP